MELKEITDFDVTGSKNTILVDNLVIDHHVKIQNASELAQYNPQHDITRMKSKNSKHIGKTRILFYRNNEPRLVLGPHCIFQLNI
jgi:hypothetical protein